eukprot:8581029-Pyramimonas_sp.AAC.1
MFLDVGKLEEDVVYLKNHIADKDKQIEELTLSLEAKNYVNNSVELRHQLAAMQEELEETREQLRKQIEEGPQLPKVKFLGEGDASVRIVEDDFCFFATLPKKTPPTLLARCSVVSREVPPIHPNFMAERNFPSPNLEKVPRPSTSGPPLITRPRTPGEAVMASWPSSRAGV